MRTVWFLLLVLSCLFSSAQGQNVGIGTTAPDASAILDLKATGKGFLAPRVTAAQRLAIVNPANGLLVYDTDAGCFFFYKNSQWISMCGGQGGGTGPTGPTGLAGVAGAVGPAGAPGAPGTDGINGEGYLATSNSSLTIGLGSKTLITQPALAYLPNDRVRISVTAQNYMEGTVISYSGLTLSVNIDRIVGGGTFSSWNIGIAGDVGAAGPSGPAGSDGPQGIQGITGPQGLQGATGVTGITGPQGIPGPTGPQGIQGSAGPAGPQGSQGLQGLAGDTGPQGIPGITGPAGLDGAGAFRVSPE